jgi:hypothetical protein
MTQLDRSSINRYVEAYEAGLREREAISRPGSRLEAAYQHIVRWFGVVRTRRATVVATMLPTSAASTRKPWVATQFPA